MNLTEAYREIWGAKLPTSAPPTEQHIRRIAWMAELLPDQPGLHLVDLGCGSGAMLGEAKRRNWRSVGVDASREVCDWLTKQGYIALHADLDSDRLPIDGAIADVVTVSDVIEHCLDARHMLAEARRVLKPGGKILVSTANYSHWRRVVDLLRGNHRGTSGDQTLRDGGHVAYYGATDLEDELRRCGYRKIRVHYLNYDPAPEPIVRLFRELGCKSDAHRDNTYQIAEAI